MDVNGRIRQLMKERSWSEYRLAKMSGLSASTLSNLFTEILPLLLAHWRQFARVLVSR